MTEPTPGEINPLVVDVDEIARRLGLDLPVDSDTADTLRASIIDAQADVEGYLGRPIVPVTRVAHGLRPSLWGEPWSRQIDDDVTTIVSATPEVYSDGQPTGTFAVTYLAGLDARNDPALSPIRRYVTAAARNDPAVLDMTAQNRPRGVLTSVSTDGQTASYSAPWHGQGTVPGSGAPGAMPTLASLYPWKRASVFQRRGIGFQPGWSYADFERWEWLG